MKAAQLLINSLKSDSSFYDPSPYLSSKISFAREDNRIFKLTVLAANTDAATDDIINAINEMSIDTDYDFKIFALMICLHDAKRKKEATILSMGFRDRTGLSCTRIISSNILLKDLLYV